MRRTRRNVLRAGAGAAAAGLAGCTGRLDAVAGDGPSEDGAYAAFFTLYDFARTVGGDAFPVENPVPPGTMGHRWEPSSDLPPAVAAHEAFVYLDVVGYQRWALDTAELIERDHPEVTLIDAVAGVDLLDHEGDAVERGGEGSGGASGDDHDDEDHDHDEDDQDAEGGDEHDHEGELDPHYWVDPIRAAESVRNVGAGFAEADPANADRYEANAADYAATLEAFDAELRDALADREQDAVVVAGHNSYQYLADRYGFAVHSPVGVSPHAEPTQDEIADTVAFVDDRGIDVILADRFEADTLAETIVRESDATEIARLSPAEGTTEAWNERGWGYLDQMREINLPALRAALGADG